MEERKLNAYNSKIEILDEDLKLDRSRNSPDKTEVAHDSNQTFKPKVNTVNNVENPNEIEIKMEG